MRLKQLCVLERVAVMVSDVLAMVNPCFETIMNAIKRIMNFLSFVLLHDKLN